MSLKVIGAGLMRTGTFSLKTALEKLLGGACYHMSEIHRHPEHVWPWHKAGHGEMPERWDVIFGGYIGAVDLPAALFWPELVKAYPDALVVLSHRDPQSWLESCRETIFKDRDKETVRQGGPNRNGGPGSGHGPMATRNPAHEWKAFVERTAMMIAIGESRLPGMFGDFSNDAAKVRIYEEHNTRVRAVVPPERLLVWHARDGWAPLCAALECPVPDEPFPHANKRQGWDRRQATV